MSVIATVAAITSTFVLARLVARAFRARGRRRPEGIRSDEDATASAERFSGFPCKLGDVVIRRAERDEAWLAGALVFAEERPVAALFVAPDVKRDSAVFVRDAQQELTWMAPASAAERLSGRDPPTALEHEGIRFDRRRRIPVRVERLGTGAPSIGQTAVVAEYAGPGAERLLVVAGSDSTLSWRGVALTEAEYDVLPGS